MLTVPVRLSLKAGETKLVELKSWTEKSFLKTLSLKDDDDKTYDLLEQVAEGRDGKTITENWMKVYLVFDVPTDKELKFLHLTLPTAAFQADGPLIGFEIDPKDIKSAETDKADKSTDREIVVTRPPPPLPKEATFDLGNGLKLEMVLIPAGEFLMGSPDSDKDAVLTRSRSTE